MKSNPAEPWRGAGGLRRRRLLLVIALAGCVPGGFAHAQGTTTPPAGSPSGPPEAPAEVPSPATPVPPDGGAAALPRFAVNSPFDVDYQSPIVRDGKRLWARSILWEKAPELVVEKWLGDPPETAGKYLLIEFWATWCGPCRRSIPVLNQFHEKFSRELAVIGISDETEPVVRKMREPRLGFHSAIDTQGRMKKELGVVGIPHAILVEPGGHVIWEGYPLQPGYELTEEMIERVLRVGRKLREGSAAP